MSDEPATEAEVSTKTWTRPSGSTIDLLDTPEMEAYAQSKGFTDDGKPAAKKKAPAKKKAAPKPKE